MKKIKNKGDFPKGGIPWNKGNPGYKLPPRLELKGKHFSPKTEFKKGFTPWNKGITWPEMSEMSKGKNNPMHGKIGELHHNWKGGQDERKLFKAVNWRLNIFERDKYTCQRCGEKGCYLSAHHIKGWAEYPKLRYDMDNGITLCLACHKLTDNYAAKANKKCKHICEVHSGLSALLADKSNYDGVWISSLTHSTLKGLPDTELVSLEERVDLVREVRRVTNKKILVDCDTGGQHIGYHAKWLADAGADVLIMEDKAFPKQNSLLEDGKHNLEDVDKFCEKISEASKSGIMIVARIESLIAKHSMYEALIRAEAYEKAGADGIMIHSKQKVAATEVMEFAAKFREKSSLPLVAVPTTYSLPDGHPFEYVIDANHLLRASLKGMQDFLNGTGDISPVEDIFNLIGHDRSS